MRDEGDITLSSYMQIHRLTEENLEFEPVKRKTRRDLSHPNAVDTD